MPGPDNAHDHLGAAHDDLGAAGLRFFADEVALRALVHRYADAASRRDPDGVADTFTAESEWTAEGLGSSRSHQPRRCDCDTARRPRRHRAPWRKPRTASTVLDGEPRA
jgi:hypothetical protein